MLNREWHSETLLRLAGRGGPLVAGAAFAIAWTPCTSITLGAILTQAAISSSAAHGALLLAFYSAGLAIPFLLIALAFERMTERARRRQAPLPGDHRHRRRGDDRARRADPHRRVHDAQRRNSEHAACTGTRAGRVEASERRALAAPLSGRRSSRVRCAKALFPGLLVALGVEHERRVADRLDDQPVDRRLGNGQRAQHVDEQHDARLVGVVPDLVVEGVVEDQALALLPVAEVLADADAAGLGVLRARSARGGSAARPCRGRGGRGCACAGRGSRTSPSSSRGSRASARRCAGTSRRRAWPRSRSRRGRTSSSGRRR